MDRLLTEKWRVTVIDNFDPFYDLALKEQNILHHKDFTHYSLVKGDITDFAFLKENLEGGYDVIIHLAAKAGVRPSILDPMGYQSVNVSGTQNLLEMAKEWGTRQFIFASSSSVYGVNPHVPWREDESVLNPISPYAATKVAGEMMGHVYSHLYGIRFIALRFFTVYGPRQRPDLAIHKFARLMLQGEAIPVYGDGTTRRDYTYIADIIRGVRAAVDYDQTDYEVINLGNSRTVSLMNLIKSLETALAIKAKITFHPGQPGDVPQTYANIDKAKKIVGYRPAMELDTGIGEFVRWLRTGCG